ncbi:MAG: hypothetical protein LUG86_08960 [Oscillospiraceae bacterium]|nr:hypothetical protein [Oscillospiraceae bacterium]
MTLLQRLRNLRTDPLVMAWVNDSDVMWLPGYSDGRIIVPFCNMKKESGAFRLMMPVASIELSCPGFELVKMERGNPVTSFVLSGNDSSECRKLFLKYYDEMDRYLSQNDDCVFASLEENKAEIENLLRRIQI